MFGDSETDRRQPSRPRVPTADDHHELKRDHVELKRRVEDLSDKQKMLHGRIDQVYEDQTSLRYWMQGNSEGVSKDIRRIFDWTQAQDKHRIRDEQVFTIVLALNIVAMLAGLVAYITK